MAQRPMRLLVAVLLLAAGLVVAAPGVGSAAPYCDLASTTAPNCYVEMPDGVQIALSVKFPPGGCSEADPCPTIFEMSGYDGAGADPETGETLSGEILGPWYDLCNQYFDDQCGGPPLAQDSRQLTQMFDADYVTIHASVRGTGCSGGEFDLFSPTHAQDGARVIEWIAGQGWSNGEVGIMGHSYGGITGFMIAAQQPRGLVAMTVSGLIDDLYRGIVYKGGVSNSGFPLLWTGVVRPLYDVGGGVLPGVYRPIARDQDPEASAACAANVATHSRALLNDPIVEGAVGDTDNAWWHARALSTYAGDIEVPIHVVGAYQDEQTGPRGPTRLWEMVSGVPKRLILTNGDHGTNQASRAMADRRNWMDHWMLGEDNGHGAVGADETSVTVWLDATGSAPDPTATIEDDRFPLSDTDWTSLYLGQGEALTRTAPGAGETPDPYVSGSQRQSWSYQAGYDAGPPFTTADGPDEATYSYTVTQADGPITVAGPMRADLWIDSSGPDSELYVQLIDEAPDGSRSYLQRGLLKASHRGIDLRSSDCVDASNTKVDCREAGAILYRPHRPHTAGQLVTPGAPEPYQIEIFPAGHVFRPGHRIMLKVFAPPAVDSFYAYVLKTPRGINRIWHDAGHPSRLVLPVVPTPAELGAAPACGAMAAVRCVAEPNG